ncbi:MAG: Asp-tRNA(Asn)/Glu-tRNA(Gln) amidotransferase subunit GatC [Vampirovibrionales bacterium]|nr:Asp-tRNA(Asn)/Glu-tRNA(Gln) amidotransferase subunit GatC [Vampirovibrionales bacterium]
MKIDETTVRHVAKLASLDVTDEEVTTFSKELSAILDYVDLLSQADFSALNPADRHHEAVIISGLSPLRPDVAERRFTRQQLMINAALPLDPDEDAFFRVPKILES